MKIYSEICPKCGTWNYNLDLEETEGCYECECCKEVIQSKTFGMDITNLPLFDLGDPIDQLRLTSFCKRKEVPKFKFRKLETMN